MLLEVDFKTLTYLFNEFQGNVTQDLLISEFEKEMNIDNLNSLTKCPAGRFGPSRKLHLNIYSDKFIERFLWTILFREKIADNLDLVPMFNHNLKEIDGYENFKDVYLEYVSVSKYGKYHHLISGHKLSTTHETISKYFENEIFNNIHGNEINLNSLIDSISYMLFTEKSDSLLELVIIDCLMGVDDVRTKLVETLNSTPNYNFRSRLITRKNIDTIYRTRLSNVDKIGTLYNIADYLESLVKEFEANESGNLSKYCNHGIKMINKFILEENL